MESVVFSAVEVGFEKFSIWEDPTIFIRSDIENLKKLKEVDFFFFPMIVFVYSATAHLKHTVMCVSLCVDFSLQFLEGSHVCHQSK